MACWTNHNLKSYTAPYFPQEIAWFSIVRLNGGLLYTIPFPRANLDTGALFSLVYAVGTYNPPVGIVK